MGRGTGKRQWAVFGEVDIESVYPEGHPDAGEHVRFPVNPAAVEAMAADVACVVNMVGGTAVMGSDRRINPWNGMYETVAVYWEWHSYAPPANGEPPKRAKRSEEAPAPAPPAAEFQQPEPEPQEPPHDERDPEEFTPLSPEERAYIEQEEGALT